MEINIVRVRNIEIGKGIPKICVPIIEETQEDVLSMAEKIYKSSADIAEWRIDFYNELNGGDKSFCETLKKLRVVLGDKPLLITFRTLAEGGNRDISLESYIELIEKLAALGYADMEDVEVYRMEREEMSAFIKNLKKYVTVVGSYHDFDKTPDTDEMIERLMYMDSVGADIPKLAVMPKNKIDVIRLMEASAVVADRLKEKPVITMSMSDIGMISRIAAQSTGSAISFGCLGKASAPGQIEVGKLKGMIEQIESM